MPVTVKDAFPVNLPQLHNTDSPPPPLQENYIQMEVYVFRKTLLISTEPLGRLTQSLLLSRS